MKNHQVLVYLLGLVPIRVLLAQPHPGSNGREFGVLCAIAELAGKDPQLHRLKENTNVSALLEDFRHFELLSDPNADSALAKPDSEWLKKNEISNQSFLSATATPHLKRSRELAIKLSESCRTYEARKSSVDKDVKRLLKKAVFGEDAGDATVLDNPTEIVNQAKVFVDATSNGRQANYAASCASNVQNVGKTLVNDMFCLCVGKTTSQGDEVCVNTIKGDGNHWPQIYNNVQMPNSWKTIYAKCPKPGMNLSAESIRNALDTFRGLLGQRQSVGSFAKKDEAPYFFGLAGTNHDCDGQASQNICVNYFSAMTKNEPKGIRGVAWANGYLQAAHEIEEFNRIAKKCENDYQQLQLLHAYTRALFQGVNSELERAGRASSAKTKEGGNPQAAPATPQKLSDSVLRTPDGGGTRFTPLRLILLTSVVAQ